LILAKGERRIITHCSWEAFGDFAAVYTDENAKRMFSLVSKQASGR